MREKWKIGKHPSEIISDTKVQNRYFPSPPNPPESEEKDLELYGGYLVCESVGNNSHAKLIANAPEMLRMLQQAVEVMSKMPVFATPNPDVHDRLEKYAEIRRFTEELTKEFGSEPYAGRIEYMTRSQVIEVHSVDCTMDIKPLPILDKALNALNNLDESERKFFMPAEEIREVMANPPKKPIGIWAKCRADNTLHGLEWEINNKQ